MKMNGVARAIVQPAKNISRAGKIFIIVFLIIVFEGVARKWISASLTLPLIATRDFFAAYLIFYAWRNGYLQRFKSLITALLIWSCCFLVWGMIQIILGENNPLMLILGFRFWLLYVWFGCAAAATMTERDYRASISLTVGLLLILVPLAILQYYSPPGAQINTQLDGDESDIFLLISGIVRPTSTFSFTLGYTTILALTAPFVFAVVDMKKRTVIQSVIAAVIFIIFVAGSIVSGSRGAVIYSGSLFVFYIVAKLIFSKNKRKGVALLSIVFSLILISILLYYFQGAIDATQQRFQEASEGENFWIRLLTIFIGEPSIYDKFSWLGYGLGSGSNLASYVESGSRSFPLAESEAGRILLEGGLLGYVWTLIKLLVITYGLFKSWRMASKLHFIQPLVIWISLTLALLTWPSIGQITSNALLGIMLGLSLMSLKYRNIELFQTNTARK